MKIHSVEHRWKHRNGPCCFPVLLVNVFAKVVSLESQQGDWLVLWCIGSALP